MTVGQVQAAFVRRSRFRRFVGGRAALWLAFALVHALLIVLNFVGQNQPLHDVTEVYRNWTELASDGIVRMGIDAPWVYPILAFAPMTVAMAFGPEWYGETWLALVTLLDAAAFSILIGTARLSRTRATRTARMATASASSPS